MNFRNLLGFWPRAFRLMLVNGEIFADQQIRNTKTALTGFFLFQFIFVTAGCVIANRWSEVIGASIVGLSALMVMLIIIFVFVQLTLFMKALDVAQKVAINTAKAGNALVPGQPIDPNEVVDIKDGYKVISITVASLVVVIYADTFILVFRAWFYPRLLLVMLLAGVAVSLSAVTWGGVRAWLPIIQKSVYILFGTIIVGAAFIMVNPGGIGAILSSYTAGQDLERVMQQAAADQDVMDVQRTKVLAVRRNQLLAIYSRTPEQDVELGDIEGELKAITLRHEQYVRAGGESTTLGAWLRQNQQIVVGVILVIALLIFLSKWKGGTAGSSSTSGSVSIRTMVIIVAVLVGLWWFSPLIIGTAKEISDAYPLRGGPKMQEPDGRRAPANLNGGDWEKVVDMALDPKVESQDTKFVAEPGDELYIMAKGTVKCDPRWKQAVSLDGTTISETGLTFVCPEALMGQLLVMTPGEAQPVGTRRQIKVQKGGPISVGINDLVGWFGDNTESGTRVVILRKKRDGPKVSARATTTSESSNRWLALFILYRNITFYDIIFL